MGSNYIKLDCFLLKSCWCLSGCCSFQSVSIHVAAVDIVFQDLPCDGGEGHSPSRQLLTAIYVALCGGGNLKFLAVVYVAFYLGGNLKSLAAVYVAFYLGGKLKLLAAVYVAFYLGGKLTLLAAVYVAFYLGGKL